MNSALVPFPGYVNIPRGADRQIWTALVDSVSKAVQDRDLEYIQSNWPAIPYRRGHKWSNRGMRSIHRGLNVQRADIEGANFLLACHDWMDALPGLPKQVERKVCEWSNFMTKMRGNVAADSVFEDLFHIFNAFASGVTTPFRAELETHHNIPIHTNRIIGQASNLTDYWPQGTLNFNVEIPKKTSRTAWKSWCARALAPLHLDELQDLQKKVDLARLRETRFRIGEVYIVIQTKVELTETELIEILVEHFIQTDFNKIARQLKNPPELEQIIYTARHQCCHLGKYLVHMDSSSSETREHFYTFFSFVRARLLLEYPDAHPQLVSFSVAGDEGVRWNMSAPEVKALEKFTGERPLGHWFLSR